MTELISPDIPKGTRDLLPKDMAKRQRVMEKITSVFINFGYDAIETPALEYAETLLGGYGNEDSKLAYTFRDQGGRQLALRYDQTVPFARFVAAYRRSLPMPFKRYQVSRVWRADRPGRGRYREFHQCDVDIIGTRSLLAEGEIAKVTHKVFESLGFDAFAIKFNSRRLINSMLTRMGVDSNIQPQIITILDTLEKVGRRKVAEALKPVLTQKRIDALVEIATAVRGTNMAKIEFLQPHDTSEIESFLAVCDELRIPSERLIFDPALVRGLDYYTGVVFEVFLRNVKIHAVCAGGRYDNLCSLFSKEPLSGVGVSFGFDRIVLAMEELNIFPDAKLNSRVLITHLEGATLRHVLGILDNLRTTGINAEIYFEPEKLEKQLKYAKRKEISFVVICGPDEIRRGELAIRAMKTGKQKTIPQNQLITYLKGFAHAGNT